MPNRLDEGVGPGGLVDQTRVQATLSARQPVGLAPYQDRGRDRKSRA